MYLLAVVQLRTGDVLVVVMELTAQEATRRHAQDAPRVLLGST